MQLPKLSDVSVAKWFAGFLANEFLETLIVEFGLYVSLTLVNVNNTYMAKPLKHIIHQEKNNPSLTTKLIGTDW